jgi:hypothetical protein
MYGFGLNRCDDGGAYNGYNPLEPSVRRNDETDDLAWKQSLGARKRQKSP